MPDKTGYTGRSIPTSAISQMVDASIMMASNQRKNFERRWYDNNFFDDGFHFRYISRSTGKVVDLSDRGTFNIPQRAIPKASRQIRGVTNLLLAPEYVPVVYPEKISRTSFEDPKEYEAARQQSKKIAQKQGQWVSEEFKNQEIEEKLILMLILAAKHGVSYLQIWPDAVEERIKTQVYDAFDIYVMGNVNSIYDSPFLIKAVPQLISVIKANENFDQVQLGKISPDNKYASSEIKQAYMNSRFGNGQANDQAATLILKEAFFKEYLTEENIDQVQQLATDPSVYENKHVGDMVMRHVFCAGGVYLLDEYINLPEYPFVDFRYEPGPIYQVPQIERFIPANKSLDIVVSRIEQFINTMVSGTWLLPKGQDFQITNVPGGQKLEYDGVPPTQGQISSVPPFVFNFIGLLEKVIEEQGASTTALQQIPTGVRSGVAIESVKSIEYSNLKAASMMLKQTVRHIAEKFIEIASNFIDPQDVYLLQKGEPQYFEIIGEKGIQARKELGLPIEGLIPIKKSAIVNIEVESGLGFTMEGKKATMQQINDFVLAMAKEGLITQDAVKVIFEKLLETFQFGSTQEFMEAMETGTQASPLTEDQLTAIKVSVLEALKDAGVAGPEAEENLINSTKVGVVEALKDTGMLSKQSSESSNGPSESMNFKDLPPEGKAQMAAKVGIVLDPSQMEEMQEEANANR